MGITYVFNDSNDDWLITDEYQLPNNGTYSLEFMARSFLANYLEDFNVLISTRC